MFSRTEITKIVHDAVKETFDLKSGITDDSTSFKDDLDANSLDMVSLALVLEDELSAEIEEGQIEYFKTINDVINYIMDRQLKESA